MEDYTVDWIYNAEEQNCNAGFNFSVDLTPVVLHHI